MTAVLGGVATVGAVAACSLSLHAGYGLLSRLVSPGEVLDAFPR